MAALVVSACGDPEPRLEVSSSDLANVDTWIRNGQVIDGTGSRPTSADVLIRGDSIVFVGRVPAGVVTATDTIDATGKVVAPGFIDVHSHGNPLGEPEMRNFLAMGVTTITLGQDGASPLEGDGKAWMDRIDSLGTGPNVVVFSGHGTLREQTGIGRAVSPPDSLIDKMTDMLRAQLRAGAAGLSTGLEYAPGMFAGEAELLALAGVAGEFDRVVMSHLRNEDDDQLETSVRELLRQGRHARVHISHLKSVYGKGSARADEVLKLLDNARSDGVSVTADVYPYTASYTDIGILFPVWAKSDSGFLAAKENRRDELARYLREKVTRRNGPQATLIGTGPFTGRTLAEVADSLGKPFEYALIDDIGPGGASAAYFVMDEELQQTFARHPLVMFASDGSRTGYHPRGHGTFAKVIEEYVLEERLLTLEEAVRKMTALPSSVLRLDNRGILKAHYMADVVVFDPESVRARATYEHPHRRAEGFDVVIVGGRVVKNGSRYAERRLGSVIRK